jgi:membrane-associated phospholipid phosphatase
MICGLCRYLFAVIYLFISFNIYSCDNQSLANAIYPPKGSLLKAKWLKVWVNDFFKLQTFLFTADTVKVLAITIPAYIGTRRMDNSLQCCFYRDCCHKNVCQAPKGFHTFANVSVPTLIGLLTGLTFVSDNPELRLTSFVYTEAVISYWIVKNIFKNCNKCDWNMRPKHEAFSKDKCYYGGCPSGHVGEAAVAAVLFGLRHGPKWGVPLGVFTAAVFAASINGNRHYLSQSIAGLGLGLIYGLAAYNLIESKISCPIDFCTTSGAGGYKGLRASYSF